MKHYPDDKQMCSYGDCTRSIWYKNPNASLRKLCNEHWTRYLNPPEMTREKLIAKYEQATLLQENK